MSPLRTRWHAGSRTCLCTRKGQAGFVKPLARQRLRSRASLQGRQRPRLGARIPLRGRIPKGAPAARSRCGVVCSSAATRSDAPSGASNCGLQDNVRITRTTKRSWAVWPYLTPMNCLPTSWPWKLGARRSRSVAGKRPRNARADRSLRWCLQQRSHHRLGWRALPTSHSMRSEQFVRHLRPVLEGAPACLIGPNRNDTRCSSVRSKRRAQREAL